MSTTINKLITANGTFTFPPTMVAGSASFTAVGGMGGPNQFEPTILGAAPAVVTGLVTTANPGDTWTITIGQPGTTPAGGAGFHAGGSGGILTTSFFTSSAGGGGGSTAIQHGATLLVEAAGGGGRGGDSDSGPDVSGAGGIGTLSGTPSGSNGGFGSQANNPGLTVGTNPGHGATSTADGSGGTNTSSGNPGAAGSSGVGGAGASFSTASIASDGGGGGGGGHKGGGGGAGGGSLPGSGAIGGGGGGGAGSCIVDSSVSSAAYNPSSAGGSYVIITFDVLDNPLASTLLSPATSSFLDSFAAGVTFSATYNPEGAGPLSKVALRLSMDGAAYGYWDGTDFTTTVLGAANTSTWVVPSTGGGATDGQTFTLTIPAGVIADGHVYTWSLACEESSASLLGPFPSDFLFSAAAMPTVSIFAPFGTTATITPNVEWTETLAGGDAQTSRRTLIYEGFGMVAGTPGAIFDSGVLTDGQTFTPIPASAGLMSGNSYTAFVQITETGGLTSAWASVLFNVEIAGPVDPTIVVTATTDAVINGTTGLPGPQAQMAQGNDNILPADDANFANGVADWLGVNCILTPGIVNFTTGLAITSD